MEITKILVELLTKEEKEIVSKILRNVSLKELTQLLDVVTKERCHQMCDDIYDTYFEGYDSHRREDPSKCIPELN